MHCFAPQQVAQQRCIAHIVRTQHTQADGFAEREATKAMSADAVPTAPEGASAAC